MSKRMEFSVSPRVSLKQNSRVSSSRKMFTLRSSDGEEFEIEENVAEESQTFKYMIELGCTESVIPLPNINSKILSKVIEYSKKHAESDEKTTDEELKAWDADFVKVDQVTLFDLILAANYLNIDSLVNLMCKAVADMIKIKTPRDLDLTCEAVAGMIKSKTPVDIRKTVNNNNDLTPEEKESAWGVRMGLRVKVVMHQFVL